MMWLLVALGGALGAPTRYLTDRFIQSRHTTGFPWGTFAVNIVGSFILGVALAALPPQWEALVGIGFCGALTTYSTFSYEILGLAENRRLLQSLSYAVLSIVVGLGTAFLGHFVAS